MGKFDTISDDEVVHLHRRSLMLTLLEVRTPAEIAGVLVAALMVTILSPAARRQMLRDGE